MERTDVSGQITKNEKYIQYHDEEWGIPVYDDQRLFEMLVLESFQAGLSWECVLNKREAFRKAFDDFDLAAVCSYGEEKITALKERIRDHPKSAENTGCRTECKDFPGRYRKRMEAFLTIYGIDGWKHYLRDRENKITTV